MDISYDNGPIRKRCGKASGKLKQRLDEIKAAPSMADLVLLPGKHHALKANRTGTWGCHIEEPNRLVYRPLGNPVPITIDGHLELEKVTAVLLLEVIDYHDE
jgi:proteic killer suppression protein